MEKQRIKSIAKSCRRLLVFGIIFLLNVNLYSQILTDKMLDELFIVPSANQNMYAKEDIHFEVIIPLVKSSQVQIHSPSLDSNVSFRQMKKTDCAGGGVNLEIWLQFSKKGDYSLSPLKVVIQGKSKSIKFEKLSIFDNPADMSPRFVINFSNGIQISSDSPGEKLEFPVGEKISFTINLQYVTQLIQFDYNLPKDSIFTQTELYEFAEIKYREKKYTNELIPVATFEWTGLKKGIQSMPYLKMHVTDYKGYRVDLVLPETKINFVSAEKTENNDFYNSIFDEAFEMTEEEKKVEEKIVITDEICNQVAQLRQIERNSFINHKQNVEERKKFEESLSLPVSEKEFFILYKYISLIFVVFFLILFIIMVKIRKVYSMIASAILLICSFAFSIYSYVMSAKTYGIFKGGKISSIPEKNAESYSEISAGNRVHILEQAGEWYYIEIGETGGWCNTEKVILIK